MGKEKYPDAGMLAPVKSATLILRPPMKSNTVGLPWAVFHGVNISRGENAGMLEYIASDPRTDVRGQLKGKKNILKCLSCETGLPSEV